jgi:GntR family transcriptional regulator
MDVVNDFYKLFERLNFELHPESPVPIYYQLSRYLEKMIQDEVLHPGSRFPSEEAIAEYFEVSRPTASKAVQILLNEGWLARDKQDKRSGTFVKGKPYVNLRFLTEGFSFADQFPPDVPIRSEIIWKKSVPAVGKVAKMLHLEEGEPVFSMRRLRFACEQPIMVCDSMLPENKFPNIATEEFLQDSLYKTLEVKYKSLVISSDRYAMAVEVIEPEIIKLLNVPPFSSILRMTGVSYTYDDTPVDYLQTFLQPGVSLMNHISRQINKNGEQAT